MPFSNTAWTVFIALNMALSNLRSMFPEASNLIELVGSRDPPSRNQTALPDLSVAYLSLAINPGSLPAKSARRCMANTRP
jgi:hypothetical protein